MVQRTNYFVIDALDECGCEGDRKILMKPCPKGFYSLPCSFESLWLAGQNPTFRGHWDSHLDVRPYPLDNQSTTIKDVSDLFIHRLEENT